MDVVSFVVFSFNTRYILRWIYAGLIFFIPVVNFFSLGYLARTSSLSIIAGIGLPTWDQKSEIWREGAKVAYIVILYEALPCFFFSLKLLLSSIGSSLTNFLGMMVFVAAVLAVVACSFFLPFAFYAFVEAMEVRKAFDFERITVAVREVLPGYVFGYVLTGCCLLVAYKLGKVPIIGIFLASVVAFYVLLISAFYFGQLFKKTSLSMGGISRPGTADTIEDREEL
jgi:hypothetical protein